MKVAKDEKLNEEEVMKNVDAIETKVKFRAFGKTKETTLKTSVQYGCIHSRADQSCVESKELKFYKWMRGKGGQIHPY